MRPVALISFKYFHILTLQYFSYNIYNSQLVRNGRRVDRMAYTSASIAHSSKMAENEFSFIRIRRQTLLCIVRLMQEQHVISFFVFFILAGTIAGSVSFFFLFPPLATDT